METHYTIAGNNRHVCDAKVEPPDLRNVEVSSAIKL